MLYPKYILLIPVESLTLLLPIDVYALHIKVIKVIAEKTARSEGKAIEIMFNVTPETTTTRFKIFGSTLSINPFPTPNKLTERSALMMLWRHSVRSPIELTVPYESVVWA